MSQTLAIAGKKEQALRVMRGLTQALAGRSSEYGELVRSIQMRIGMKMLEMIQADFIAKSRGGTGLDGVTWKPLDPKTVAYSRRFGPGEKAGLKRAAGVRDKGGSRPFLSAAEDKRWRQLFAQHKAMLMAYGVGDAQASNRAAAMAWSKIKASGGKTKLMVYGQRAVEILRDTGELFGSFSVGMQSGAILEVEPGNVTVGTNRKPWHHRGVAGKLPARPFWPLDGDFPPAYWQPILQEMQAAIADAVVMIMGQAA